MNTTTPENILNFETTLNTLPKNENSPAVAGVFWQDWFCTELPGSIFDWAKAAHTLAILRAHLSVYLHFIGTMTKRERNRLLRKNTAGRQQSYGQDQSKPGVAMRQQRKPLPNYFPDLAALDILYEDEHLVVVNGRQGMLTRWQIAFSRNQSIYRVCSRKNTGEIFTIHRLDKDTS